MLQECVSQLSQANQEARLLKTELDARNTNLHKQQQEKTQLLGELVELQKKYNNVSHRLTDTSHERKTKIVVTGIHIITLAISKGVAIGY